MVRTCAVYPDGRKATREIVRHPGSAAILALDEAGRIALLRQYRPALSGWLWEIPAGTIDPQDATPLETAARELAEEAGFVADEWRSLGKMHPAPGISDEVIHLYLATGLRPVQTAHEPGELIEVHSVAFEEAVRMAKEGEITDAKTVSALFRARGGAAK